MMTISTRNFNATTLLFTTLLISLCSIVYELIIGSLSSYLLGNSVTQFSVTIGLYLFAMGIGSFVSKYIGKNLFDAFTIVEIIIGIIGSFSGIILFLCHLYTGIYPLVMYLLTLIIGLLVGLEIPLLVRIIEENKKDLKNSIANLFAFDYIGGLLGSIIFPIILLPQLGYVTTAFVTGLINLTAAAIIVFKYSDKLKNRKLCQGLLVFSFIVVVFFTIDGDRQTRSLEDGLYRDHIIYRKQSLYQKIILTKHKDDLRLYLDGNIQFSSKDEYRYHEPLVHVPMSVCPHAGTFLLLGAGDGLAAREILKYPSTRSVTIVDLDADVVNLTKNNKEIGILNNFAFDNPKVSVIFDDAYLFLENNNTLFDVIIVDLPDPNNDALNKLYTTSFYRLVKNNLNSNGVMVTQSSSPFYTNRAFWCINKTIAQEFQTVVPYHVYIPSFGDWGFNMAADFRINTDSLFLPENIGLKYLNKDNFNSLFKFANDEVQTLKEELEVNTLFKPVLVRYYDGDIAQH